MSIIKAEGIILRSMKMGETSKLLTLFTREHGVLKVIAKGSRSRKSRYGATLDLLNVISLVYYHKDSRDLQLLSAADLVETFPRLSADLEKWGYAAACGELMLRAHPAAEATPKLYPILLDSLRVMNESPAGRDRIMFLALQMKLLGVFGVAPNFRRCRQCGADPAAHPGRTFYFHVGGGACFCENCNAGATGVRISHDALSTLSMLQSLPARRIVGHDFTSSTTMEMEKLVQDYFRVHLEEIGRLHALEFIGELTDQQTIESMEKNRRL